MSSGYDIYTSYETQKTNLEHAWMGLKNRHPKISVNFLNFPADRPNRQGGQGPPDSWWIWRPAEIFPSRNFWKNVGCRFFRPVQTCSRCAFSASYGVYVPYPEDLFYEKCYF